MMASRAREARGGQLIGPWADRAPRRPAPKSKIQFNGADGLRAYISSCVGLMKRSCAGYQTFPIVNQRVRQND
jgi:hypothetical protein